MHNYSHKKLIEVITQLDALPMEQERYGEWIKADAHLSFLRHNAGTDELVVYANGEYTFVDSIVLPNHVLAGMSSEDLEQWCFSSYDSIASYVYGGGREDVSIERGSRKGYDDDHNGTQLVFVRSFEGWEGAGQNYIEVNQEYTHLAGIHWRPEKRAYCRFDRRGDLESVVSVTTREGKNSNMALVTFKWEPLERYLSIADAALVRRFDFTLLRRDQFGGWPQDPPEIVHEEGDLYYRRKVLPGYAAYTAGRQVVRPRRSKVAINKSIKANWGGDKDRQYAEFVAYDWRNERIATISTAPGATVNYFNAKDSSLPFELSPAFFRPEVLSKYKTDREKYSVGERDVACRAAWHLKGLDVNEAGQIHAYLCDLRQLPYEEQLHWLSFNEPPKSSISERARINDFRGEFVLFSESPARILSTVRRWHDSDLTWWKLRDEHLLHRVNTPLTSSRDEWAESFLDLAKLVVEGFETTAIRAKLDAAKIPYNKDERTITLLERLLNNGKALGDTRKLTGMRTVQNVRSKAKGHASGSEARDLAQEALLEHETYADHFKAVCGQVFEELKAIEELFVPEA